ncbi:hypothetical protein RvY_02921 [Ramazzottius varieornatus]|uniref:MULE transposase domain-containing protein n=1 Tax=Ramazzottius varieornatus TaxID=947166 RepID=A0A1D1UQ46_RAMVA|nr:hypothetical protein RvY_02921 [Ramazzottius varieornatus]
MDGTFQIVPKLFHQLYTIHVEHFGGVFPVIFALLPNKSSATNERLFRGIRDELEAMPFRLDLGEGPKPKNIVVDYERAVINTAGKIFPHARVQGCYFHFSQAVWRNVQRYGLTEQYLNDDEFGRAVRMVLGLAYCPRESIRDAWQTLLDMGSFATTPKSDYGKFLKYFSETWIGYTDPNGSEVPAMYPSDKGLTPVCPL